MVETNFHQKLGSDYVFKTIGKIVVIIILVAIPFIIFWVWMLIDCAKRPIEDKTVWILIIVLVGVLGAILYFFIPRRKHKKELQENTDSQLKNNIN